MNCPSCPERLWVTVSGPRVECPTCKRAWTSDRLTEILKHMTDQMSRQFKGLVNHMDFDDTLVEVTERPDV